MDDDPVLWFKRDDKGKLDRYHEVINLIVCMQSNLDIMCHLSASIGLGFLVFLDIMCHLSASIGLGFLVFANIFCVVHLKVLEGKGSTMALRGEVVWLLTWGKLSQLQPVAVSARFESLRASDTINTLLMRFFSGFCFHNNLASERRFTLFRWKFVD